MTDFELTRHPATEAGAFGLLSQRGEAPFALTLERTYGDEGEPQHVKIPPGPWLCRRRYYNRGGVWTYEVTGVPGHSALLFHAGNIEGDSEGCILLGLALGDLRGEPAVLKSRLAFEEFMRRAGGRDSFLLAVREVPS